MCQSYVTGMTCAACVGILENHLSHVPGISKVLINLALQNGSIEFDNEKVGTYVISEDHIFIHFIFIDFNRSNLQRNF